MWKEIEFVRLNIYLVQHTMVHCEGGRGKVLPAASWIIQLWYWNRNTKEHSFHILFVLKDALKMSLLKICNFGLSKVRDRHLKEVVCMQHKMPLLKNCCLTGLSKCSWPFISPHYQHGEWVPCVVHGLGPWREVSVVWRWAPQRPT